MKRVFITSGVMLLLAACQTREVRLQTAGNSWLGVPVSAFLSQTQMSFLGSFDTSDGRNFMFENRRIATDVLPGRNYYNRSFNTPPEIVTTQLVCKVTLLAQNKSGRTGMDSWVIVQVTYNGDC